MPTRNSVILGFTIGYLGAAAIACGIAYLCLMPFGYGYVGAELTGAYLGWCTIQQWESVNEQLAYYLDQAGV